MTGGRAGPDPVVGEWRGSGRFAGLRLPADVHAAAEQEYRAAVAVHGAVDAAVADVSGQLDVAYHGAQIPPDESLKSWESYRRKVATGYQQGLPAEAAVSQHDLHRYTYIFPPEQYTDGVDDCYRRLAEAGFTAESGTNYWGCDRYKGINTVWRHEESGQRVEFQFHTPRSYEIKQETHLPYEVVRGTHLADGVTEVPQELTRAKDWRAAELYRSTDPGQECAIPPRHESLWPDRFDRSQTKEPPGDALASLDREVAELERERSVGASGREVEDGESAHGLPERIRRSIRHDPARFDGWNDPGAPGRERGRERDE